MENISNNARLQLSISQCRCFTDTKLLILSENEAYGPSKLDIISEFSIRPPELCTCFDQVGNYYRWFHIDKTCQKKDVLLLLNSDIRKSAWTDGYCRVAILRQKDIHEVIQWLDSVIQKDEDFNELS